MSDKMSDKMYILWVVLACLLLCVLRIIKGPSIWDRLLGFNLVSTKVIIMIILFASLDKTAYYLDFAIVYALLGFVGTVFIALFLQERIKKGWDKWN